MAGWTKTSGVNGSANQTTLVLGAIAAGQFIRVQARIGAIGATVTCADNQDSAYTLSKSQVDAADNTLYEFRLYPTVNTASRTVTITTSAGSCRIIASWFTPPTSTTSVALSTSNGATGSGTSVASGNATAANGDLVGGAASVTNSASVDWTAGGTSAGGTWATDQDFNDLAHNVYSQYVVASAGGTFASTPVYGGTDSIASLIVVYAATGGGGSTRTFSLATTGASAPAFTFAGMTDTFTVPATGKSAPVFTLAGMTDPFSVAATGRSAPVFTLAGMTDPVVFSATGKSVPAFTLAGMTDAFSVASTGASVPSFGVTVPGQVSAVQQTIEWATHMFLHGR